MTRDNLLKRNLNKSIDLFFFSEPESVQLLLGVFLVARLVWKQISCLFSMQIGVLVESVTSLWVAGKILDALNTAVAAVLRALWNHRNAMIFNKKKIINFLQVIYRATSWIRKWGRA